MAISYLKPVQSLLLSSCMGLLRRAYALLAMTGIFSYLSLRGTQCRGNLMHKTRTVAFAFRMHGIASSGLRPPRNDGYLLLLVIARHAVPRQSHTEGILPSVCRVNHGNLSDEIFRAEKELAYVNPVPIQQFVAHGV